MEKILHNFLIKCNIINNEVLEISLLDGIIIPREQLLDEKVYDQVKEEIPKLKTVFSSSMLTSLQENAERTQKWPLINIVRQLLKAYNYKLEPKRLCNGYSKDGKKLYKRIFIIEKLKDIKEQS